MAFDEFFGGDGGFGGGGSGGFGGDPWGGYDPSDPFGGGFIFGDGGFPSVGGGGTPPFVIGPPGTNNPGSGGGSDSGGGGGILGNLGGILGGVGGGIGALFKALGSNPSLLQALLGGGSAISGAILSQLAANDKNNLLSKWADSLKGYADSGIGNASGILGDALSSYKKLGMQGGLTPQLEQMFNDTNSLRDKLPGLFNNQDLDPRIKSTLESLAQGINSSAFPEAINAGRTMMSNSGMSPFLSNTQDLASEIFKTRGETPELQDANKLASGIAATGGMTPELKNALTSLQGVISQGGGTALTQALGGRGLDLFNRESLLPMQQVLSNAKDSVARNEKNAAEAALRQAQARNGSAPVVSGLGNQALVDFGDTASNAEAKAVQDAMQQQQQLQLEQAGMGENAAAQAGSLGNTRFSTAVGGTGQLSGIAGDKTTQALQLLSTLANTATNRLATGGNLGLEAGQQGLARVLGGGNLSNNTLQNFSDLLGKYSNTYLQNQNLNLNRAGGYTGAAGNLLGLGTQQSGTALDALLKTIGGYGQIGTNYLGSGYNALGGIAGLFGNYGSNSPLGSLLTQGGLGLLAGMGGNNSKDPGFNFPIDRTVSPQP